MSNSRLSSRSSFAYVISVDGPVVTLNLHDDHRGQMSSHPDGVSGVTEIGSVFGILDGTRLVVARVRSLSFAEAREAHRAGVGTAALVGDPLRHLVAVVVGFLVRRDSTMNFSPDSSIAPPLGAEAYPLSVDEARAVHRLQSSGGDDVTLGESVRGFGAIQVPLQVLLPRHVAVLGSTGYGKSSFTAAILQQMLKLSNPRIVVFDVNGEYSQALRPHCKGDEYRETILGGPAATKKIPYYALGRHGLSRLLLPSEKTQRPALNFALEKLSKVEWCETGTALVGSAATMFDDCRTEGADAAYAAISKLRIGFAADAAKWPPLAALSCLIAESHSLKRKGGSYERDAFLYGNVSGLVTRVRRFMDDPMFTSVVEVGESESCGSGKLSWETEASHLVADIFGGTASKWKVHVVNISNVAHDLMPHVLGSLLELLAFELFKRGQGGTHPTLLVLEEAHHYLRQTPEEDGSSRSSLAYERLAKEGRKFGLSMWLSTQRPSEVSTTVLSQCGSWVAFRLTGESDLAALSSAAEWIDRQELRAVAGLPRQHALVFGAGVPLPVRITAPRANPPPKSDDPRFSEWL